jgi:hypothetical protein
VTHKHKPTWREENKNREEIQMEQEEHVSKNDFLRITKLKTLKFG